MTLNAQEIQKRRDYLLSLGLSQKIIENIEKNRPALYPIESIKNTIQGLKERGFTNPEKMITSLPTIFNYSFENIDGKIQGLKERGFTNLEKMITSSPAVLSLSFENIDGKIQGLKERGFTNPEKMITSLPTIFNYSFENIDGKIQGLKERGFTNPEKMITSFPAMLGLSFDNMDGKIQGLKERGFNNPEKMITSFPAVLGYSFENIDGKIKMLEKLNNLYKLDLIPTEVIEKNKSILSSKIDKLWVLARIIKENVGTAGEIDNKLISKLLFANLESIVLASRTKENQTINELIAEAKKIKKEMTSKEEKRELISNLPEDDLLKKRFERGYPLKNK